MEAKSFLNKRKSFRIDTQMDGYYSIKGNQRLWKKCTVINFSREGTGILFFTNEAIAIGSTIHLKVDSSEKPKPISIKGTLTWIKKGTEGFIGGIKW
jgi:Tfp pilus assembly protein PilZ